MRTINQIIIHCSATPSNRNIDAKEIDRWHKLRGWKCIGYHYIIKLDGTIEVGRPESMIGAHCSGHNANSIGICYIGGCDDKMRPCDTRTSAQRISLRTLVETLRRKYPRATIHGHNEFSSKACPCFNVSLEFPATGPARQTA